MKLWKPLSILEKIWSLNHYFFIEKNKRADTELSKPNYESSLVAIYYKIEGNYFKGKIWLLYQLKTTVTTLTSGISTHTTTNVSLTLTVAV